MDTTSSSEEDDFESETSDSEIAEDLPARVPWDTKKRKRTSTQEMLPPDADWNQTPWDQEFDKDEENDDKEITKLLLTWYGKQTNKHKEVTRKKDVEIGNRTVGQ